MESLSQQRPANQPTDVPRRPRLGLMRDSVDPADRAKVIDIVNRLNLAFDHFDIEAMVEVFTEDCVVQHPYGTVEGHEQLRQFYDAYRPLTPGVRRHSTDHVVDANDDGTLTVTSHGVLIRIAPSAEARPIGQWDIASRSDGLPGIFSHALSIDTFRHDPTMAGGSSRVSSRTPPPTRPFAPTSPMPGERVSERWSVRPEGSTWGDFGEDDQHGRINLITEERRLAAVREVRTGRVFVLSLPLDTPMGGLQPPFRQPPQLTETAGHSTPFAQLYGVPGVIDIGCDDTVTLNTQCSTQWDALCHVGALFDVAGDGNPVQVYYNGFRAGTDVVGRQGDLPAAARRLGIEHQAETGVQGRGVMIDLHAAFGDAKTVVDFDLLQTVMHDTDVSVEAGDIVCFHTGFAAAARAADDDTQRRSLLSSFAQLDGHDERLLQWITDSGVAAIVADNLGVEGLAPERARPGRSILPLHHHCLFKLGVPIGELWYLTDLADWLRSARRSRFLLTAPPLRLTGAVASPVTPVATV